MRWRLLNLIPVVTAGGDDITRSAAGRLATETVFVPTMFRRATWTAAEEPDTAVGTWRIGKDAETVRYRLGPQGDHGESSVPGSTDPSAQSHGTGRFGILFLLVVVLVAAVVILACLGSDRV